MERLHLEDEKRKKRIFVLLRVRMILGMSATSSIITNNEMSLIESNSPRHKTKKISRKSKMQQTRGCY